MNFQVGIDTLTKQDLNQVFDFIKQNITFAAHETSIFDSFTRKEFSVIQFQEYQNKMIEMFGNNELLFVVAKNPYDLLINTGVYTAKEWARHILDFCRK